MVVFIAMPFNKRFNKVYDTAIKPAIHELGFQHLRVDEISLNTDIIQDIENGIRNSDIVFGDITGNNSNVYYELGLARALGKSLIVATQTPDDVKFDLVPRRFIPYDNSEEGIKKLKRTIKRWIKTIIMNRLNESNVFPKVYVHGTKFDVPKRNEFWNDLFKSAERKFILLGGSNKSWIKKSEEQCNGLAGSIIRIIKNNGEVIIISGNDKSIIQDHKDFFKKYLIPKLKGRILLNKFNRRFKYGVVDHSNYQIVISDNKIVILPSLNSKQFKDETLILELEGQNLQVFKNYQADVERLFKENKCQTIKILSNGRATNTKKLIGSIKRK